MKKYICSMIVLLISSISLFAATSRLYKPIELQAAYGAVCDVSVTRIPSQSQQYMIGMPFNIEDKYVRYRATNNGREIASWTLISNTPFKLRITADEMVHTEEESTPLSYILTFSYNLGYNLGGNSLPQTTESTFSLGNGKRPSVENGSITDDGKFEFSIFPDEILAGNYVGSVIGSIFFMFSAESTQVIEDNIGIYDQGLPAGNYSATVRIEMISEA